MRIEVDDETPVLQGTTAQIKGVGFTGVSEIQLGGAVKGARPITQAGPQGCPVIPASSGGLGALLNSAPELIDRIQRLTERLTELLSDKNQNSIADILENVDKTTKVLAERAPDLADAIGRCAHRRRARRASPPSGSAVLADSTNTLGHRTGQAGGGGSAQGDRGGRTRRRQSRCDGRPTPGRASRISASRPCPKPTGWSATFASCRSRCKGVSERVEQGGIGGTLGPKKLPDYKPRKER